MAWAAFEQTNGPLLVHDRIEAMLAVLCSLIANAFGERRTSPTDFLPRWGEERREQSVEDMIATFTELTRKG